MKILAAPIDAIVVFKRGDPPRPYKFKYECGGETATVLVDKILAVEKRRIAGIPSIIYACQSVIDGMDKRYELKYLPEGGRWELYKI